MLNLEDDENRIKNLSLCLAAIASVEVPLGYWNDFIQIFSDATAATNSDLIRFAAIQTLGYLSEFMENKPLSFDQLGLILTSTIQSVDPAQLKISRIAVSTLLRVITQTKVCFENDAQRDYIMAGIFKAISV
jgi:importin subunit beta-1